jgi:hypothetical protein
MIVDSSQLDGSLRSSCHKMPCLWQASEWYLDRGGNGYSVSVINDTVIKMSKNTKKENFFLTVLKVVSYITLIFPLLALIIKTIYRKHYQYEVGVANFRDNLQTLLESHKKPVSLAQGSIPHLSASQPAVSSIGKIALRGTSRKKIHEDPAILSKMPKRISDGEAFSEAVHKQFNSWRSIISMHISFCKFKPDLKREELLDKCQKVIPYFCDFYNCGMYMTQDIDDDQSALSQAVNSANLTVRNLSEQIQKFAEEIAAHILSVAYKNKENPPPEFLVKSPSKAVLLLKTSWEKVLANG